MSSKIGVLVIHGMGSQRPFFAADLVEELSDRLGADEMRFVWQPVYWARFLQEREETLWSQMLSARDPDGRLLELDWQKIRRFVMHNFGDAVAYHHDCSRGPSAYVQIHDIISASLAALKARLSDPEAPIVVVGHSLGCHMISDYVWDRQKSAAGDTLESIDNLWAMITFGCNIPLFALSFSEAKPIRLPGKGIRRKVLKDASRWKNFYDPDDVLGWPLKPLYLQTFDNLNKGQKATVERIEDHAINVGGLGTAWNPAAHGSYWTDNDLTKPVASYLKQLLTALDS